MNRTWLGVGIVAVLVLALIFALTSGGDDAPAPTTTATSTAAPTTAPPPTSTTTGAPTTTTTAAPTTTLDPEARAAEIEALVQELEFALFDAVYRQDADGLGDLIGTSRLWDGLQDAITTPSDFFSEAPTPTALDLQLSDVLLDRSDCIVAEIIEDPTAFLKEDGRVEELIVVVWPVADATFGWRIAERWAAGTPDTEWQRNCDIQDRTWRP